MALLVVWADRRFMLGHGQAFYLYVIGYTIGRAWIEHLRIDPAHLIGPFRLNDYVSVGVCLLFVAIFVVSRRRHPERESSVYLPGREPATAEAALPSAEACAAIGRGGGTSGRRLGHQPRQSDPEPRRRTGPAAGRIGGVRVPVG